MNPVTSPRIEFAVTPRFDVFYALYTLTSTASTPLDAWKDKASDRLPRDFARVASRVAPLPIFWPLLADASQRMHGEISFDELLSAIRETLPEDIRRSIVEGILHDNAAVDSLVNGRTTLKQFVANDNPAAGQLLSAFGLKPFDAGSPAARAINSVLKQPEPFRDALVDILEQFWVTGFHDDWVALEPVLRDESFRMRDLRDEVKSSTLESVLNLPVRLDDSSQLMRPRSGANIPYQEIDRCYVIPSAFNTKRWWAKYETSAGRVMVYLPVTRNADLANGTLVRQMTPAAHEPARAVDINAEAVFRALGDTTRYAIASILARTPTTSADLARSLKVSKPTITHHVQSLRSAGLIKATPAGGSTKLSLSRDTLAALSGVAVEQLFTSSGALTLGTTRKRRNT